MPKSRLLLQDEHLGLPRPGGRPDDVVDIGELWQGKALDEAGGKGKAVMSGLTGLRGAQGGVVMFGMMGQFLPAAAATIVASNPVLLGVGRAVRWICRSRKNASARSRPRRQSARQQVRQFMDDVQFEVTNEMTGMLRDLQRDMRDEFGDRLAELQRTYTDTAQRAQKIAQQTQEQSKKRAAEIDARPHRARQGRDLSAESPGSPR